MNRRLLMAAVTTLVACGPMGSNMDGGAGGSAAGGTAAGGSAAGGSAAGGSAGGSTAGGSAAGGAAGGSTAGGSAAGGDAGGSTAGGSAAGGDAGGSTAGGSAAGGSAGGSTAGGAAGTCMTVNDCAAVSECQQVACISSQCVISPRAAGPVATQTPGDCRVRSCDGLGALVVMNDNTDLPPDDGNACTTQSCLNGMPTFPAAPVDTACAQNGGSVCNASAQCVACNAPSQCPGTDTECRTRTCTAAGACGFSFTPGGTLLAMQTAGDCQTTQCNGSGDIAIVAQNADVPVDGNQCTNDVCTNGVPSNPAVAINSACTQNGGAFCNAMAACVACNTASQCPGSDTACRARTCSAAGVCGVTNTPAMQPVASQTPGDCRTNECDGFGSPIVVVTNADVPNDNNQCTSDVCTNGVPSNPTLPLDTACTQNGGAFCNATGACVACNVATQCTGSDTECRTRTCSTAGACGVSFTPSGTAVTAQTTGDCQVAQCNGSGAIVSVAQNTDVPVDGNQCTSDVCTNGVPSNPALAINSACTQNGGAFCNATGACVACNVATQCTGSDTECRTRTCSAAGVCGVDFTPAMSPVPTQTAGDCRSNECDGFGTPIIVNANLDVPVDNNQCTSDVCTAGVPSNPPLPVDTSCTQNGGAFCNSTGACVACNVATQCGGTDTECRTRTCTAGACGVNFTPNGTALTAQTAGNCRVAQCDGSGGIANVVDDTDVPVDGNQCTNDLCSNGTPSNAPATLDTSCAQNGGTVCNATGTCVACNTASQCTGSDTDCQTRTCTSNTCGFSYASNGTPVSAQVSGDCKQVQCNGSGGTTAANLDSDVPVDGAQCTDDVCTMGVPSNPPLSAGAMCNQSGGTSCDGAGACVAPPTVVSTTPADGTTVAASTPVAITFNVAMNAATVTGQTSAGACTGSIQVSVDNFSSCIAFSAASAAMSAGNTSATLTPAPGLLVNTTYRIRVTTAATGSSGLALTSAFTQATGFTTSSPNLCDGSVVISQVYGGGGNAGATFLNDFVELHNRGTAAVSLAGWSIQYASSTGNTWQVASLSGSIGAGGYFLVQLAGGANGVALPTPDATGTINLSGTTGKVALVSSTTPLPTNICPTGATVVDFVGFGTANCSEGATAPAPSNSTSIQRVGATCADVNANSSDFTAGAPAPRNSSTPAAVCACLVHNETSVPTVEADYCVVQFPLSLSATTGATTALVYGRLFEFGTTEAAGANATVRAQLGYGAANSNPQYQPWTWTNATFNVQVGNDDEYQASFTAPAVGSYLYAYRISLDQGVSWTVCDTDGAGANPGLSFQFSSVPVLNVTP
ncbi:MAG: lamin tail domain-containing protein [Myxococcales bacterium]|nr:lamin tail domain-containing protein [Myxococcales bacterium]